MMAIGVLPVPTSWEKDATKQAAQYKQKLR